MINEVERNNVVLERSRLFCPIERNNVEMFFSLVDYRNNYFTSDDPSKIIEFYNGFENRNQLMQWMKERPKGIANIHEVDGDKDIIVVIPTADFNGKYAKECRENIFKGLHMVFVESGSREDFYFNFAHNCNVGIRKAIEYNSKWVVVSNDDMVKIDDVKVLKEKLTKLDENNYDVVFTNPSPYHSIHTNVSELSHLGKVAVRVIRRDKVSINLRKLEKKFEVKFAQNGNIPFLLKNHISFTLTSDFAIFSYHWVSNNSNNLFDEQFINAYEDLDISIRLKKSKSSVIDYKIEDLFGSSLGNGENRKLRSFSSRILLDNKIRNVHSSFK